VKKVSGTEGLPPSSAESSSIDARPDARPVEHDVGAELVGFCRAATRELKLMGAAVTLMTTTGSEAIAAFSDDSVRQIEEIQFSLGEGPARDAFALGRPILTRDMGTAFSTWPGYAPEVCRAGVGAAFAFPLQLGAVRFGVLTLYDSKARALSSEEISACLIFVEVVNETLMDGAGDAGNLTPPSLAGAVSSRAEVYQAQGMVMVDLGVSLADALARMRAYAFSTGQTLNGLAVDIVEGRTRLRSADDPGREP
jgi:GAF domain/ANTAR domain